MQSSHRQSHLTRANEDLDSLARSTLDSLTGIIFDDDARVAKLELRKIYAAPGEVGATRAEDRVEEMCARCRPQSPSPIHRSRAGPASGDVVGAL